VTHRTLALVAALLLISACGGGGPAATTPGNAPGTTAPAGTPQATPATTGQPGPTGGQGATDFCLNTPEEVATAYQVPPPNAVGNENPGFGGGCIYSASDGSLVHSIGWVPVQPGMDTIQTGLDTPGAVAITGIGEAAVLMSDLGPLVFRHGQWIVSTGGNPSLEIASDPAAYRAALETLARAAASRMP
jgi:hypothetical protein